MGNCCASKASYPDNTHGPQQPEHRQNGSSDGNKNESTSRLGTTAGQNIADIDLKKSDKDKQNNPLLRIQNLNQLPLRRELPNSYVNSIQSSTNPDDGHGFSSSTPNTATHIGYNDQNSKAIHSSVEPSGQVTKFQEFALDEYPNKNNHLQSQVNSATTNKVDRRSVISAVSEFRQNSIEIDEKCALYNANLFPGQNGRVGAKESKTNQNKKQLQRRANQARVDLGIPAQPRLQIYRITNEFPVSRPYSSTQDWQRILHRYSMQQQQIINDKPMDPEYDELAENLLSLSNRNWIRDQLKMHQENRLAMQDSLSNLVKQKQSLQLREHFTWLVWAVAQYYFGGPERQPSTAGAGPKVTQTDEVDSSWNFQSRATIVDQDVSAFDDQDQSNSIISRSNTNRQGGVTSTSQKPTSSQPPQPTRQTIFTCKLPKTNSAKWSEGFSFKGVFFRLLPYEDASHVLEELKALKYIQTELLDLQAQEQTFLQQQADSMDRSIRTGHSNPSSTMPLAFSEGHLHKDVILPLLVGVKCCGFYLYGTPLIYTQEMKGESRESFRASTVGDHQLAGFGSSAVVNMDSETCYPDPFSDNFILPKFSSVNPVDAGNYPQMEQFRRASFGYLHDNIDEDTMRDPVLQRMPLLKNLSRRNLIPVIDFEEFNQAAVQKTNPYSSGMTNNSRPSRPDCYISSTTGAQIQINYLMVYLASTLRTLSQESTASVLFSVPSSISEDMVFCQYPVDKLLEVEELEKMIQQNSVSVGHGPVSAKPQGDIEEAKLSPSRDGAKNAAFNRRFLAKHGWHCFMIDKRNANSKYTTRGAENKRASQLYNQRENSAGGLEPFLEKKESEMQVIMETNEASSVKAQKQQQTPQSMAKFGPQQKFMNGPENLDSTPRMQAHSGRLAGNLGGLKSGISQSIFTTPMKKTVMKRIESTREEMVYGNVVVCATLTKGFKIQYSLTQHTYANGIDTMFQLSLEHVAKILDTSDRVSNIDTLKNLMHRKGLNLRFLWVLLTKVKLKFSRDLIMAAILIRTMRKVINEETKLGSTISKPTSTIPFVQASQNTGSYFNSGSQQKSAKESSAQQTMRAQQPPVQEAEYYQGNRSQLYRECLTLFANAVMKNKFAKYKHVFNETLLGLFLSRLKIITLAHSLELSQTQLNYLESKDIINHVLEMPSQNPIMFLNSMQAYFNIEFKTEFTRKYRQDKFFILNKPQPIGRSDITAINHRVMTYFSLREQAYFILARKISAFQYRQRKARQNRQNLKQSQASLAKVFTRMQKGNDDVFVQSFTDHDRTDRHNVDDGTWSHQKSMMNNNFMNETPKRPVPGQGETYRNFKNFQNSAVSGTSDFRNIIDLSRSKRNTFKPTRSGELLLPPVFYKLVTTLDTGANANSTQDMATGDGYSVFQTHYEIPNADIINEWVIVLESLFNEVYSIQGREAVLLEALTHQCIMTLFLEQDLDSAIKILQKIRELLLQTLTCAPEIIVLCMMLTGVWQDMNDELEQFPIESEKNYLAALIIAFQIYGDSRGRGNYSIPYYLFFTWKLSLLSQAEYKKNDDSEFAEELFDSTLSSLFNHKRSFKAVQMDLISAQEQALSGGLNPNPSTGSFGAALGSSHQLNSSTFVRQGQVLHFEQTLDHQDIVTNHFDLQKYRRRPQNVVTAGGFVKPSQQLHLGLASAMKNHNEVVTKNGINDRVSQNLHTALQQPGRPKPVTDATNLSQGQQKSSLNQPVARSDQADRYISFQVQQQDQNQFQSMQKGAAGMKASYSMSRLQKSNLDADISEIDIEFKIEDDEERQRLVDYNFRESETIVGKLPFQHWTINRNIIASQQNVLNGEKPADAKQMRKEMIKDQVTKQVDMDALFPWIVTYNPVMTPTGLEWNSKTIKEVVFCQNTQIIGSSEPSSVTFSSHKMSQYSYRSNSDRSALRRRAFLNPYSSYVGKEVGGIQKGEILGQLYTWGTDQYGQLGLEYFISSKQMGAMQSLKILHPRMLVPLKNELIKEVCCGHGHSLAINQFGQMYSWGQNNCGQLGIGDGSPDIVRKPVLNTSISNVAKLAAGHEHSLALSKTQELFVWGFGPFTGLNQDENVYVPTHLDLLVKARAQTRLSTQVNKIKQIDCYGLHSAAVTQEGELFTWGSSEGGQLGHEAQEEDGEPCFKRPTRVEHLAQNNIRIAQVACGETHTVVLTTEDQIWGWGLSMYGQLGLGFSEDSFEPGEGQRRSKVMVPTEITQYMPPEITVAKIICGAAFTLFLTTEHELYGCGINDIGQLGLETQIEEMQMAVLDRARQKSGGMREVVTSNVTVPSRIICFENIKVNSVSCGENHSLALLGEEKSLWSWGMFRYGQLGQGEVQTKMNPRPIQSLLTTNVHKLAAGSLHSMALLGDSNHLTAMAANFFLNSDLLNNPWSIDFRKLSNDDDADQYDLSIALKPKV